MKFAVVLLFLGTSPALRAQYTERVSVDSAGNGGDDLSLIASSLSADGRFVAFLSMATNLVSGDTNGCADVFVHDRATGTTERVSVDSAGNEGNDQCIGGGALSADGRFVAFASKATNLVAGDTNFNPDVFVRDRLLGTTARVSVDSSGVEGNHRSDIPAISADGNLVAFESRASNLVQNDSYGPDLFVHNRATGETSLRSVSSTGEHADRACFGTAFSANGRVVAFVTRATNLVDGDLSGSLDAFVHEKCVAATSTNYGAGVAGTFGVPALTSDLPILGSTLNVYCENSLHAPTVGILFLGFQRAQLHTNFGGDLLLLPVHCVPITFSFGLDTLTGTLPDEPLLCGEVVDLQVVEADPGAVKGVSFTPGLELVLGK